MNSGNVSTAREALMAELLQDVDALVLRFEKADGTLAERMEQATKDAAAKAFLAARLNFESVIEQQAVKLTDAGRHSAALIGLQLNSSVVQIVAAHEVFERKSRRIALLLFGCAFAAGVIGGVVGGKLASLLG